MTFEEAEQAEARVRHRTVSMAKDEYKGDAEAHARSLENPAEFSTQVRNRRRKSIPEMAT